MGIQSFEHVERLFSDQSVSRIHVKFLAQSQDNDKNQIYLGPGLSSVVNLFPADLQTGLQSQSSKKKQSSRGVHKIEAVLDFAWLDSSGAIHDAPDAKIIDYFQYPEVRFSGFLKNCSKPPDSLRKVHQESYGQRILLLGSNPQGETYGLVITEAEDPLVSHFPELPPSETVSVFKTHVIGKNPGLEPKDLLIKELVEIVGNWHPSLTLKKSDTSPVPFRGNQGAGYTLEALLGVPRNSSKKPDKYGFEIKSFKQGGKISLMTPTPDRGEQGNTPFPSFMSKFGYPGERQGKQVFGGTYYCGKPSNKTGFTLEVLDLKNGQDLPITENRDGDTIMGLFRPVDDSLIAGWSFQKLLDSWSPKHALAAYVEYEKRPYTRIDGLHDHEYRFTGRVHVGTGTTIFKYIDSVRNGTVYYEPGDETNSDGKSKQRPQWRMSVTTRLNAKLSSLYEQVETLHIG